MKFSASALAKYWQCPEMYRKIYIDKSEEKEAAGEAMVIGIAAHAGVEELLQQKIDGLKPDIPAAIIKAEAALMREVGAMKMQPSDIAIGGAFVKQMKQCVQMVVRVYERTMLPATRPTHVEANVNMPWGSEDTMTGRIDMIDAIEPNEYAIRDLKVSMNSKTPDKDTAEKSIQLRMYALAATQMFGRPPKYGILDHFVNSKRPHFLSRVVEFTPQMLAATTARVDVTLKAIKSGVFPPGDPFFKCTPDRCYLYGSCKMGGLDESEED